MTEIIIAGITGACALIAISALLIVKKIKKKKTIEIQPEKSKNQIKGEAGEQNTAEEFKRFFENEEINYKILKNIYLKFENGNTTEIDIIIISEYGIFVIENKNYRGWIFGSFKNKYWTDSYLGGVKVQFYNPLKQNYTHIKTLKNYINEKYHDKIYSYIVFGRECELKKVPYSSEFIKIIKTNDIIKTLKESKNEKCITIDEIEQLYNKLYEFTQVTKEEKEKHIENIKKR